MVFPLKMGKPPKGQPATLRDLESLQTNPLGQTLEGFDFVVVLLLSVLGDFLRFISAAILRTVACPLITSFEPYFATFADLT